MATFKSAFKGIQKSILVASRNAANRALVSTRAKYAKDVSAELKLPSKRVKARSKVTKATNDKGIAELSIGVRVDFALHDFSPGSKVVNSRIGKRRAATYSVRGSKTTLNDGSFLTTVNNTSTTKKLILKRSGDARYPLITPRTKIFLETVERMRQTLKKHMLDVFNKNFSSELAFQEKKKD